MERSRRLASWIELTRQQKIEAELSQIATRLIYPKKRTSEPKLRARAEELQHQLHTLRGQQAAASSFK